MNNQDKIRQEIFSFDEDVFSEFKSNYGEEIDEFINNMNDAFSEWEALDTSVKDSEEASYFAAVLFWAFSSLLHSFKLFCHGYQTPSGNLMRQCVEAIAFAVFASDKSNGVMKKFMEGRYSTNKAVARLNKSHVIKKLDLNKEAVKTFVEAQKFYSEFSHPSQMTIATFMSFEKPGDTYVGGSYDSGKKSTYDQEFALRTSLSNDLGEIISNVKSKLESW